MNSLPELTFFLNGDERAEAYRRANLVFDLKEIADAARAND
jgi:hypothetical protein